MLPIFNPVIEEILEAESIFINQIVYDKKSRGERVYTYSLGEAFFEIPGFVISDEEMQQGYHYSNSMGQIKLREKIGELYKDRYHVGDISEDEILISAGSKVLIYMILQTVLSPGDEVIYFEPAWLSYKEQVKLLGGTNVPIPYNMDIYDIRKYVTSKTKALILNNPNNPSGSLYSTDELEFLLEVARENSFLIISDEAYSDFLLPKDEFISFARIDEARTNTVIVNSLSKNMGMSGWRVGYIIAHKEVIKRVLKLNQHMITCAPTILQNYMAQHFDEILATTIPQAVDIAKKRYEVSKIFERNGINALEGVGTFYFLIDVSMFPGTTEELVYDLLLNHNIAVVPGGAYGESTRNYIRFGIGVECLRDIEESINTINSFLELKSYDNSRIRFQLDNLLKKKGLYGNG